MPSNVYILLKRFEHISLRENNLNDANRVKIYFVILTVTSLLSDSDILITLLKAPLSSR